MPVEPNLPTSPPQPGVDPQPPVPQPLPTQAPSVAGSPQAANSPQLTPAPAPSQPVQEYSDPLAGSIPPQPFQAAPQPIPQAVEPPPQPQPAEPVYPQVPPQPIPEYSVPPAGSVSPQPIQAAPQPIPQAVEPPPPPQPAEPVYPPAPEMVAQQPPAGYPPPSLNPLPEPAPAEPIVADQPLPFQAPVALDQPPALTTQPVVPTAGFAPISSYSQQRKGHKRRSRLIGWLISLLVLSVAGYFVYTNLLQPEPSPETIFRATVDKLLQTTSLAYSTSLKLDDTDTKLTSLINSDFKVEDLDDPAKRIFQQDIRVEITSDEQSSVNLATTIIWHQDKVYLRLNQLQLGEIPPTALLTSGVTNGTIDKIKDKWLVFEVVEGRVVAHQTSSFDGLELEDLQNDQLFSDFFSKRSVDGLITFVYETFLTPNQGLAYLPTTGTYVFMPFSWLADKDQRQQLSQTLFGSAEQEGILKLSQCQHQPDKILSCQLSDTSTNDDSNQWTAEKLQEFYQPPIQAIALEQLFPDIFSEIDHRSIFYLEDGHWLDGQDQLAVDEHNRVPHQLTSRYQSEQLIGVYETNYTGFNSQLNLSLPDQTYSSGELY